jgi:tetratricopeptide (TPR) repeat protein
MGTPDQGIRRLPVMVGQLAPGGPSPALAGLHLALARLYWQCGRFTDQLGAAEQALAVAEAMGDTRLLAAAHGARGTALETMGRIHEGLGALREALRLAESIGELVSPSDIETLIHAANASAYSGRLTDAARYMERALSASERLGDPGYIAWSLGERGGTRIISGDWEVARADLERAVALHRQLGNSSKAAWTIMGLGWLCTLEGAWEEATGKIEEALAIAERGGDRMVCLISHSLLAEIDARKGRPAAARARLLPLLDHQDMQRQLLHFVVPGLAWAHSELGEASEAAALIAQVVDHARDAGEHQLLAEVLWLQALVASRQGRWEETRTAVEEGLTLARSMPYPYVEARTLWAVGLLHVQKGEPEPAREKLEAALAIFRRLGACKDVEQTEQLLATHLRQHQ